jgi:catechol 2,3-dioxygenase-like lactoylglutathione lyase family enzyme
MPQSLAMTAFLVNDYDEAISFFVGRLGSGLIGRSQKMTVAARALAEKKTVGHRS